MDRKPSKLKSTVDRKLTEQPEENFDFFFLQTVEGSFLLACASNLASAMMLALCVRIFEKILIIVRSLGSSSTSVEPNPSEAHIVQICDDSGQSQADRQDKERLHDSERSNDQLKLLLSKSQNTRKRRCRSELGSRCALPQCSDDTTLDQHTTSIRPKQSVLLDGSTQATNHDSTVDQHTTSIRPEQSVLLDGSAQATNHDSTVDQHTTSIRPEESVLLDGSAQVTMLLPNTLPQEVPDSLQKEFVDVTNSEQICVQPGSTILTAKMSLHDESTIFNKLQNLAQKGIELDVGCTLQIERAAIFYKTNEHLEMLVFERGVHDVPIITSVTNFQDRVLMIKGAHLQGAEIKAIHGNQSATLVVFEDRKLADGFDVVFARVEPVALHNETLVCATKNFNVKGHSLVVRSDGVKPYRHRASLIGWISTKIIWLVILGFNMVQVILLLPGRSLAFAMACQTIIWILSWSCVERILRPWNMESLTRWLRDHWRPSRVDHPVREARTTTVALPMYRATTPKTSDETHDSGSDIDADLQLHRGVAGTSSKESTEDGQPFEVSLPVTDPNWEWPCYEQWFSAGRWHTRGKAKEEVEEKWPFHVITRFDRKGSSNFVRLHSSSLIEIVEKCLPHAARPSKGKPIDVKDMFHAWEGLRKFLGDEGTTGETVDIEVGQCHVKHLLRFLEREFKDTLVQYELMKREGCVSWDMLWAFFVPGEAVFRRCKISDQQCYATVKGGVYWETSEGKFFIVDLNVMDYNIESYHKCTLEYKIEMFDGEVPFTSLKVCPMYFFPERGAIEDKIRKMGDGFYRLAMAQPFSFMHFTGSMNFMFQNGNCWQLKKLNADGRVMVDLLSFARMNPDYPLGNAEPPCDVLTGLSSSQNNRQARKKPDAEELKFAPAIVYGFSFRLKQWGCFEVCGFREIAFKDGAFESLVMRSENQKQLLLRLVEQYVGVDEGGQATATDPIPNKGDGCIILCHGPTGTGKTLTAEALAETLHRPLWSISAFELGNTPADVERTLNQILDIAWTWRAILLLDEADAYLEKRKEGMDVSRNLTTGVFLRLLEYYCGVMFLTTNRVTAFDEAILSRMSLTLRYPALDDTQRLQIWKTLLSRVGLHDVVCEALLQHKFNGREMRNIVRLAQTWAHSRKQALNIRHVCDAMDVVAESSRDLHSHLPTD